MCLGKDPLTCTYSMWQTDRQTASDRASKLEKLEHQQKGGMKISAYDLDDSMFAGERRNTLIEDDFATSMLSNSDVSETHSYRRE